MGCVLSTLKKEKKNTHYQEKKEKKNTEDILNLTVGDLHVDVLSEILYLLPIQSLLRFRSTSKSLRSLIDSEKFIQDHFKKSTISTLVLRLHNRFYLSDFPNLTALVPLNLLPLKECITDIAIIGSSNGVLCLVNGNDMTFLNPNTRKVKTFPHPAITDNQICVEGFGHDEYGNYKVVRISSVFDVTRHPSAFWSMVTVFSSETNSWKDIGNMPYPLFSVPRRGTLVLNYLHWIVSATTRRFQPRLVAFDLTLEIFKEVDLPEIINKVFNQNLPLPDTPYKIEVSPLEGSICMVLNDGKEFEVWLMKEYENKDSWARVFVLRVSHSGRNFNCVRPLGYSRDRSKILVEGNTRRLFWYDLNSDEVTNFEGFFADLNEGVICIGGLTQP
jgi:F-box interacting protein